MKKLIIEGNHELSGTIKISGAKNSAVALIPAAILSDNGTMIFNVPNISDTDALIDILKLLNGKVEYEDEVMRIDTDELINKMIPEELSKKLRASYYFMGALLGRFKKCEMYFPGGCNIGSRPINLHLKGFEQLGAKIEVSGDKYTITAEKLVGTRIYLDFASVGATINLMYAACRAEGVTIIDNAAKEPEIVNIATFLNNMGAKISGAGTSEIKITGVTKMHKAIIDVIPDRIEAGTYIIAGALMGNNLKIEGIIKEHLEALTSKLKEIGIPMEIKDDYIIVSKTTNMKPINIKTLVYPGFPTDLGQPINALLTQCGGTSYFEETIYDNRIGHIKELCKLGADIKRNGNSSVIIGPSKLRGCEVKASDLRAGATLVLAGLLAEGTTTITEIGHILRGYDNIVEKLTDVGAKIKITE